MKHLRRFFESTDNELEEILDNLIHISDILGRPGIGKHKFGKSNKYILTWNLGMNVSELQDAKTMVEKLKTITDNLEDVLAAEERLGKWNFNMSLTTELRIEMNPKDLGDAEFEFIKEYQWRTLYLYKNEIERFFNSKGIRVTKWDLDSSYDEYSERNDLEIYLDKENYEVTSEFVRLLEEEITRKEDQIDRPYEVYDGGDYVAVRSLEEKSGVDTVLKN